MRIDTTINRESIAFAINSLCSNSTVIDCSSSSKAVDFKTKEIDLEKFYKSVEFNQPMVIIQRTNGKLMVSYNDLAEFVLFRCDDDMVTESDIANTVLKMLGDGCTLYETVDDTTYIVTGVWLYNTETASATISLRDVSDADANVKSIVIEDNGMLATTGSLVFVGTKLFDMKR